MQPDIIVNITSNHQLVRPHLHEEWWQEVKQNLFTLTWMLHIAGEVQYIDKSDEEGEDAFNLSFKGVSLKQG